MSEEDEVDEGSVRSPLNFKVSEETVGSEAAR